MLLRNSVTPGAWEQHRNSTEKNREKEKEAGRRGWGQRERRDKREEKEGGERERFVTLPFTKSSKLTHD